MMATSDGLAVLHTARNDFIGGYCFIAPSLRVKFETNERIIIFEDG